MPFAIRHKETGRFIGKKGATSNKGRRFSTKSALMLHLKCYDYLPADFEVVEFKEEEVGVSDIGKLRKSLEKQ